MKYYIISGEASGDLHASNLMKSLSKRDIAAQYRCWGGDLMKAAGADLVKHYRELAFMGFTEVVMNLRTILNNISFCKQDILKWKPDVLILVDYPGFNLRIAEWAKSQGIKVVYYISPQVWAWKQSRVHKIKRSVDKMLVILPFEKEFYKKFDCEVEFVGHPLLDAIDQFEAEPLHIKTSKPVIALLPGSRKQEISTMLPVMLEAGKSFMEYDFVIAGAPSISPDYYAEFIKDMPVQIVYNKTYSLLKKSVAALVTSGTATLETALFDVPEVVCYKGGFISYRIAKSLVKINYISLVNLIMDRPIVKELVQHEFNISNLKKELTAILSDTGRKSMLDEFTKLKQQLGGKGASEKAAESIVQLIRKKI